MAPHEEPFSTPRSAVGFAFAVTLAVVTFWIAGFFVELHSYRAEAPMQRTAAAQGANTPCPIGADDPAQCAAVRDAQ